MGHILFLQGTSDRKMAVGIRPDSPYSVRETDITFTLEHFLPQAHGGMDSGWSYDHAVDSTPEAVRLIGSRFTGVSGGQIDAYDSNVDYFQWGSKRGPQGGDAVVLRKPFGSTEVQEVERILRTRSEIYRFEPKRHGELVQLLGLSTFAVARGYEYAAQGDIPGFYGLKVSDITQTE